MHKYHPRPEIDTVNHGVFDGEWHGGGATIESISPIDGKVIARVKQASAADFERAVVRAQAAFEKWRATPAPARGETIRHLGNALRKSKGELAKLITLE